MKIIPMNNVCSAVKNYSVQGLPKKEAAKPASYTTNHAAMPLNLHKNQITFGRSWSEHKSWGATINPDGSVNFKFYTYPDTKKVYVEVLKEPKECDEVDKIWKRGLGVKRGSSDPSDIRAEVTKISAIDERSEMFALEEKQGEGGKYFQHPNTKGLKAGQFYRFIVVGADNMIENVKDPYSTEQKQVMSWSTIHDPNTYNWKDKAWMDGKDKNRISHIAKTTGLRPVESLRIMEINIPTITEEGTFLAAKKIIKEIADKNLANAIEIMPVENCFSAQWGYDGVDKFAINERLGTGDELKELIDYAHSLKLNVLMDMVPNHVGPDGDTLREAGPYEAGNNDFGTKINYEGQGNRYVRDWMANAALHWADEYHVDGLRLDMTKPCYMGSDFTLKQIITEVQEHFPHVFAIAEDGENNRSKITNPRASQGSHEADLQKIDAQIDRIFRTGQIDPLNDIGFDSEWDFLFLNNLKQGLENHSNFNIFDFDNSLKYSGMRLSFPISHDEQGNLDGTSAVTKYAARNLRIFNKINGTSDAQRGQKAARVAQELLELYATGEMDKMSQSTWQGKIEALGIKEPITREEVKEAYAWGIERVKLGMGTVYTFPGPKMFFQGYQKGSLDYFKFFRDLRSNLYDSKEDIERQKQAIIAEKGYDTSLTSALADSKPGRIKYSGEINTTMGKVEHYSSELSNLVDKNPALQNGETVSTFVDGFHLIHGVHCKKDNNEIFTVKNFSQTGLFAHPVRFPEGRWEEVINSDDKQYAGSGNYTNSARQINSDGHNKNNIRLASSNVSIWKKIS